MDDMMGLAADTAADDCSEGLAQEYAGPGGKMLAYGRASYLGGWPDGGTRRKHLLIGVERARLRLQEAELVVEAHDIREKQHEQALAEKLAYDAQRPHRTLNRGQVARAADPRDPPPPADDAGGVVVGTMNMGADDRRDVLDLNQRAEDPPGLDLRRPLFGRPEAMAQLDGGGDGVNAPNGHGSDQ